MMVIAVQGSLLQSFPHVSVSPSLPRRAGPSVFFSRRAEDPRISISSCCLASSSSSVALGSGSRIGVPSLSYCAPGTAIRRAISVKGIAVARFGHGGSVLDANSARAGTAYRSAPFVRVPTGRPVNAAITETAGEGLKWWERGGATNIRDINSTQEFVDALAAAGDKLVIVEFFATWCGSCRALYPKFCKLATEYTDISFVKVNFDENKPMCKSLNVKVLPFFHIYRGAEGRLDAFSCSLSKLQKLKDAIGKHHDGPCEDCAPPEMLGDIFTTLLEKISAEKPTATAGSSE